MRVAFLFFAMLKIHYNSHPILREDLSTTLSIPSDLKQHHAEMLRLCKEKSAVGLAANQVGLRENFFFVMPGAKFPTKSGKPVAHLVINPSWRPAPGTSLVDGEEGCVSIPGRLFIVSRHAAIDAEWVNAVGHLQKKRLTGWSARVFQHEHDHLRGLTLLETMKEEVK